MGWSGFVGGALLPRMRPDVRVRRHDVSILNEQAIDEIVCAGAPAEKWRANAEPEADWAGLSRLMTALDGSSATSCVLISTVDVYPSPRGVTESDPPDVEQTEAYGRHRARLEAFVQQRFARPLIVRLPGLFGPGLKKNLVYDLINQPDARFAHSESTFQFYDVRDLWGHVLLAQDAGLSVVNLSTEPVGAKDLARQVFRATYDCSDRRVVQYDLRTRHARELAGRDGPYLRSRAEVLAAISSWVDTERTGTRT